MLASSSPFAGCTLAIATMHGKETVIAPVLEEKLGVRCVLPAGLDTDQWGTFSGEVERTGTPLDAARAKCLEACRLTGARLAVASEGSFGPHPTVPFATADEEVLLLLDTATSAEIVVREVSAATNFAGQWCADERALLRFANGVDFPTHGLILRRGKDRTDGVIKGIRTEAALLKAFAEISATAGGAFAETDMRAMHNPTRMRVIETAAHKLAAAALSLCPACSAPGFSIAEARPGLPCRWCGAPTASTLSHLWRCRTCGAEEEKKFPQNKETEDPMYCDFCNP